MLKRFLYLIVFLLVSIEGQAQINVFMGGNLQGNYSWIRGDEPSMDFGFGGGFNFVYWEREYWFLKAGLDYYNKNSAVMEYPDDYGVEPENPEDKIQIDYTEHAVGIPLTFYFRPYESRANTLLLTGTLTTMYVASLKMNSEEYGELALKGNSLKPRVKSSVGFGVGYQRQLDKHKYLNIIPSYHMDLRGKVAFNSITLTMELIFGVY
jgi:hypothetical protein